jgi:hypothetical protein
LVTKAWWSTCRIAGIDFDRHRRRFEAVALEDVLDGGGPSLILAFAMISSCSWRLANPPIGLFGFSGEMRNDDSFGHGFPP